MCTCLCDLHHKTSNADVMDAYQAKLEQKEQDFIDGLEKTAPIGCEFKVGDIVTFTNEYGIAFEGKEVVGFANEENSFNGRFIHLRKASYWFPIRPDELTLSTCQ